MNINPHILLIQGANMEYLGIREPEFYATTTAAELDAILQEHADANGYQLDIFYTNIEGEAINQIYAADRGTVDGLVMNPAGFTHAGYALRDCIKAISMPYIEVHMSNVHRRGIESVIAGQADGIIAGLGVNSYISGLEAMLRLLKNKS